MWRDSCDWRPARFRGQMSGEQEPLCGYLSPQPGPLFLGPVVLTPWPRHARWALTMMDLSAAFLLGSLAQEWAAGRETGRSGFLYVWVMMKTSLLLLECQIRRLTFPPLQYLFLRSIETFYLLQVRQHLYRSCIKVHISSTLKCILHVRSFIRGPRDCQIQNSPIPWLTTFNNT